MIRRLHVHNYRCLENFELSLVGCSSALLIGRNGAGKSTVRKALELLQAVSRGTNRVRDLVALSDFASDRRDGRMRFEIEADLDGELFNYTMALDYPENFVELKVAEENLFVNGKPIFTRDSSQVSLAKTKEDAAAKFLVNWHLVALPIVQERSDRDPLFRFKQWLQRMMIVAPVPRLISGESEGDTLEPDVDVRNFSAWLTGLLALSPSAYVDVDRYLREVLSDFQDLKNPLTGKDSRSLSIQFSSQNRSLQVPFEVLSDGEKCFLISAIVLAAHKAYGPSVCFWDEPDSHLALPEIGHFILSHRRLPRGSQFITTSHNPEVIRKFSNENTFLLHRSSHLEPTQVRPISELGLEGDLIETLLRGDELTWA